MLYSFSPPTFLPPVSVSQQSSTAREQRARAWPCSTQRSAFLGQKTVKGEGGAQYSCWRQAKNNQ